MTSPVSLSPFLQQQCTNGFDLDRSSGQCLGRRPLKILLWVGCRDSPITGPFLSQPSFSIVKSVSALPVEENSATVWLKSTTPFH